MLALGLGVIGRRMIPDRPPARSSTRSPGRGRGASSSRTTPGVVPRPEEGRGARNRTGIEPMGDLSRFAIEDLTPGEEDEFFKILEDA